MLQCALDMMACALGGRFTDWIMNRNFGFSDHNIICSVIMFAKCFWFIVHCSYLWYSITISLITVLNLLFICC